MRTAKTLIRLGGCQGCSESSLGAHTIVLVLSCTGSFYILDELKLSLSFYRVCHALALIETNFIFVDFVDV